MDPPEIKNIWNKLQSLFHFSRLSLEKLSAKGVELRCSSDVI